jgi:hypothetical protein
MDGTATASTIRATLNGDLVYADTQTDSGEPTWYCRAPGHQVTLRR